jgi:hypothetical protein
MTGGDLSSSDLQAAGAQRHQALRFEGSALDGGGAAECEVEQDFEVTPVGGFAALVVDRSPEPEFDGLDAGRLSDDDHQRRGNPTH